MVEKIRYGIRIEIFPVYDLLFCTIHSTSATHNSRGVKKEGNILSRYIDGSLFSELEFMSPIPFRLEVFL